MSFEQQANQVARLSREGFVGQWAWDTHLKRFSTGINENPQRVEVWTATVNTDPGDNTDIVFRFTLGGESVVDVTVNTGTNNGVNEIAQLIVDAVNFDGLVRGQIIPTVSGADLTFTGINPGDAFQVAVPTNPSTAITSVAQSQAALTADPVISGHAVVILGYNNTNESGEFPEFLATTAAETIFTPQVQTLTVDTGEAVDMSVIIERVMGDEREVIASDTVTGNATANTQATSLRNAINAMMPANSVVASGTGADIICTAEVAGLEFDVTITAAGVSKVNTTGPTPATSLHRAWGGVAMYSLSDEAPVIGGKVVSHPPGDGFRFAQGGKLVVETAEQVAYGETVYVELGTTDTGKLFRTDGDDRVKLGRAFARWERKGRATDNLNIGVVRLGPAY